MRVILGANQLSLSLSAASSSFQLDPRTRNISALSVQSRSINDHNQCLGYCCQSSKEHLPGTWRANLRACAIVLQLPSEALAPATSQTRFNNSPSRFTCPPTRSGHVPLLEYSTHHQQRLLGTHPRLEFWRPTVVTVEHLWPIREACHGSVPVAVVQPSVWCTSHPTSVSIHLSDKLRYPHSTRGTFRVRCLADRWTAVLG